MTTCYSESAQNKTRTIHAKNSLIRLDSKRTMVSCMSVRPSPPQTAVNLMNAG